MKLRQKLAVVLASAMVVTAVPVVTMASSSNSLHKATLKVQKDTEFWVTGTSEQTTANAIRVKFNDQMTKEVFYLKLENAEFISEDDLNLAINADALTAVGLKFERQNDTELKVTYTGTSDTVLIPILAKATGGDATVKIIADSSSTTISSSDALVFATTSEKAFNVSAGDATTFYVDSAKIAEITFKEGYKGALWGLDDHTAYMTFELDDTDFKFDGYKTADKNTAIKNNQTWTELASSGDDKAFEAKYGFSGSIIRVFVAVDDTDSGKLYVKVVQSDNTSDSLGQVVLKGIRVKSTVKKPENGDFLMDIKGDSLVEEKSNVKVGIVSEYGVALAMKDDKAKEIVAGNIEEIQFDVKESVENSMITGRTFELKLDKGHFDYKGMYELATGNKDTDADGDGTKNEDDDYKKALGALTEDEKIQLAEKLLDNKSDWTVKKGDSKSVKVEFDVESNGKAITDTLIVTVGYDKNGKEVQRNDKNDKMTFKTKVCVPIDQKDEESVKLTATGRALEAETSVTAITIKNPINITTEVATLKVGLQDQKAGKITIAETDKEMFQKGGTITLKIKDCPAGLKLDADADVEVTGGIKKVDKSTNKSTNTVTLTINRSSKEASTLTVPELTFTVDRTVPEGTYDLEISGTALDDESHSITIKDFVVIGTKNTEEINSSNGLAKGTASFAIGESKYTLNNKEVTMDAAPYIQDPGYTMVPVRYVAEAFGVAQSDILFGKGTVTIFAGSRTVQLTSGSNVAVVNGANVTMSTKVVIKEGRTYAPIGEIAKILGIGSAWDNTTKTATFTN